TPRDGCSRYRPLHRTAQAMAAALLSPFRRLLPRLPSPHSVDNGGVRRPACADSGAAPSAQAAPPIPAPAQASATAMTTASLPEPIAPARRAGVGIAAALLFGLCAWLWRDLARIAELLIVAALSSEERRVG